jgi:hypothetical protein
MHHELGASVTTPNGPAVYQSGFHDMDDPRGAYGMVRHPRRHEIDKALCHMVLSKSGDSGWLVVYREEEIT